MIYILQIDNLRAAAAASGGGGGGGGGEKAWFSIGSHK